MQSAKNKRKPPGKRGSARSRRPFVAATFAITMDGRITTKSYSPVDFTSREDKRHLFYQRSLGDAVLVGHTTVKRDNVKLGIPDSAMRQERLRRGQSEYPTRVIVSNAGRIDPDLRIFQADFSPIIIFSTTRMPRAIQKTLRAKATLHLSTEREVDLSWMLQQLRRDYRVRRVACEGGPSLFRAMLGLGLIDQLNLTIAPFLFGGDAPTLTGMSREFLPASVRCTLKEMRTVGEECYLTYRIRSAMRPFSG